MAQYKSNDWLIDNPDFGFIQRGIGSKRANLQGCCSNQNIAFLVPYHNLDCKKLAPLPIEHAESEPRLSNSQGLCSYQNIGFLGRYHRCEESSRQPASAYPVLSCKDGTRDLFSALTPGGTIYMLTIAFT